MQCIQRQSPQDRAGAFQRHKTPQAEQKRKSPARRSGRRSPSNLAAIIKTDFVNASGIDTRRSQQFVDDWYAQCP